MTSQQLSERAAGVFIISATPFAENGDLDLDSADRLTDFYLEKGISGITILGMMGEAQKLSPDESAGFLSRVIRRVNGRVPVVVGVSNAGLDNLVRLANFAMDEGAAGVMVAPLAGLGTDTKIYNYFSQVFAALGEDIPAKPVIAPSAPRASSCGRYSPPLPHSIDTRRRPSSAAARTALSFASPGHSSCFSMTS